jgi:hypothetical protein
MNRFLFHENDRGEAGMTDRKREDLFGKIFLNRG